MTAIDVIEKSKSLPIRHQFGKLILSTIVGFAAAKMTEKAYDMALDCYRFRQSTKS